MFKLQKNLFCTAFAAIGIFLISCAYAETVPQPPQTIKVSVSTRYEPKTIEVKKGQPVRLAFHRADDKNCGGEVVFPKLGIKRELPVGETVTVEFMPQESGEIAFSCGMNMMRGKIIAQ